MMKSSMFGVYFFGETGNTDFLKPRVVMNL